MNSMSHGTNDLPAQSMTLRKPARIGSPNTAINAVVLIWSVIQSFFVVLLKPWRSSRVKVKYQLQGRDGRLEQRINPVIQIKLWVIYNQ